MSKIQSWRHQWRIQFMISSTTTIQCCQLDENWDRCCMHHEERIMQLRYGAIHCTSVNSSTGRSDVILLWQQHDDLHTSNIVGDVRRQTGLAVKTNRNPINDVTRGRGMKCETRRYSRMLAVLTCSLPTCKAMLFGPEPRPLKTFNPKYVAYVMHDDITSRWLPWRGVVTVADRHSNPTLPFLIANVLP